jgi:hypothetical protein
MAALAGALLPAVSSFAENARIAAGRAAERKVFTDAEIADGFFKIAFGAEFQVAGHVDRIRKYDGPVRVFIDGHAKPDRRGQVAAVIADIAAHIDHLDIATTNDAAAANVTVVLVRDRDLASTIRTSYGHDLARRIERSLKPQCLSGFSKDEQYRIVHSDVILVVDAGEFVFFDCAYEEVLQALGPINDDPSVPWSMFNDDVQMGFFGLYDQYLLNILYDPRIKAGMTRDEVRTVLPDVLLSARDFVAGHNALAR